MPLIPPQRVILLWVPMLSRWSTACILEAGSILQRRCATHAERRSARCRSKEPKNLFLGWTT
jgi:hypothetical protein